MEQYFQTVKEKKIKPSTNVQLNYHMYTHSFIQQIFTALQLRAKRNEWHNELNRPKYLIPCLYAIVDVVSPTCDCL